MSYIKWDWNRIMVLTCFIYLTKDKIMFKSTNTPVYNLISVPQITRLLLEDAIISTKTKLRNGSKKKNQNYDKVRNKKAMQKIFSLI